MTTDELICYFHLNLFRFYETHTAGSMQHFERPCIGYIKKGSAQFLCKGKSYDASEGDLLYIAKDTRYYSVWTGSPEIEFYSISFSFVKPYSFYEYPFQTIQNYPAHLPDQIYRTYGTDYYLSVSYFYRLLTDIYQRMTTAVQTPPGKISVQPAIDYIEKNYHLPVSIDTLARLCHSCSSGFFKLFKEATGVTPIAYKHNIMVQNALDLLAHSDLTVEEISAKVGFSSSNYFRKVFFAITGKTPKEVR